MMFLTGLSIALAIALPCSQAFGTTWEDFKWPKGNTCPNILPPEACGGEDADPLLLQLLVDTSTSVPLKDIWGPVTDFIDTLMKKVYCKRYNLPVDKTKLWIANWSGKKIGVDYEPFHKEQFSLGNAWDRNDAGVDSGEKLATTLNFLENANDAGLGRVNQYTHPASALAEAAVHAKALYKESPKARNVVVLLSDGQMGANGLSSTNEAYLKVTDSIDEQISRLRVIPNLVHITVGITDTFKDNNEPTRYMKSITLNADGETDESLFIKVDEFDKLTDKIDDILKQLECDAGGGGAIEVAPSLPPPPPPPTTQSPTPTDYDPNAPTTRSPIPYGIGTPSRDSGTNAAATTASAGLGIAAPLLLLAARGLQL